MIEPSHLCAYVYLLTINTNQDNPIEDEGLDALSSMLRTNTTLKELCIPVRAISKLE